MRKRTTSLVCFLFLSVIVSAQDPSVKDFEAPKKFPETEKEHKKSEDDYLKAALWLETTPIDTTSKKRISINAWALAWVINCSYVTMEISESFINLTDKNSHLLLVGIANYTKYCLQNNYSKDKIKAFTAAIKAIINCYSLGGQVSADDDLDKAIAADKEGKLEDWVRELMK